jgi:hypothetical protein
VAESAARSAASQRLKPELHNPVGGIEVMAAIAAIGY